MSTPYRYNSTIRVNVPASATDAETNVIAFKALNDGVITAAEYIPNAGITGANTNTRKLAVVNKGAAGSGTTEMAGLTFASGVDATAFVPKAIPVTATEADLAFSEGDTIIIASTAPGDGLADPGGLMILTVKRSA